MAEIRKAVKSDEEAVLKLLSELNPEVSPERWRPFFDYFHSTGEPFYGYVLEVEGRLEGFIGTVLSDRDYDGKKVTCCNIHGWIVRDKYKSYSLKLVTEVLKNDMVFTCFSAMELTQMIFRRLKFFTVEHDFRIFRPKPSVSNSVEIRSIHSEKDVVDPEEKRIISAHLGFGALFFELTKGTESCLIGFKPEVYTPFFLKAVPWLLPGKFRRLLKLEYVGNPSLFDRVFSRVAFRLMVEKGCLGFIVPQRQLEKCGVKGASRYFGQRPYMYRFNREEYSDLLPDTLFSELFVLNHPG